MEPETKDPWLRWAVFVAPAFGMALSWPLTSGLPFVSRVAIGVAVALVIFGVVYVLVKGLPR
jgi:fatty acid desaturase